jgi:hypothetical protein
MPDAATNYDALWEQFKEATKDLPYHTCSFDNPITQARENWGNQTLLSAVPAAAIEADQDATMHPWSPGELRGDPRAVFGNDR